MDALSTRVLGVRLDPLDRASARERVIESLVEGTPLRIATINLDFIRLARRDPRLAAALESADLALCDGKILQLVGRVAGSAPPDQITGHDLVDDCCALAAETGKRVLLLGAAPGVASRAAYRLAKRHRRLAVAAEHGGWFGADGVAEHATRLENCIRAFAPDLVFVGLGCPKQELWLEQNLTRLGIKVGIGVGSVLDVLAGDLPRAPRWMQVCALESLFQCLFAPRRYFTRYVLRDPPVLGAALIEALARRASRSRVDPAGARGQRRRPRARTHSGSPVKTHAAQSRVE
jgi:N-acetylglucosaminyldiphosphoundecaprenol N-acetyl-beta-D-mannosaminyltransferase